MTLEKNIPLPVHAADPPVRRGPGRPTARQARQRNDELLEVALEMFLENGFDRTTIESITSSVGMAKRTVYANYGDKKNLFKAALKRAIDEWAVSADTLNTVETDDLEETLRRIAQILIDNILSPTGLKLLRITNSESSRMPEIGAYTNELGTKRSVAYLADLFERRIHRPAFTRKDAEALAFTFLFLIVGGPGNMAAWGLRFDQEALERHVHNNVHLFLHGALDDWNWMPAKSSAIAMLSQQGGS